MRARAAIRSNRYARGVCGCAVLTLALIGTLSRAYASDPVGSAQAFVTAAVTETFAGAPLTDLAEALRATSDEQSRTAILVTLALSVPRDIESALARAAALAGTNYADPVASGVLRDAIMRGELGLPPGSPGVDPLVLVQALRFASSDPDMVGVVPMLLAAVQQRARPDGSLAFADNDGDVTVTAEAARVLADVNDPATAGVVSAARAWLSANAAASRLPDADVAVAALAIGESSPSALRLLLDALGARQAPSGAFDGGDLRATALAIQALRRGLPDLRIELAGTRVDAPASGIAYRVTVTIRNAGWTESMASSVAYHVSDASGSSVLDGTSPVPALAPGSVATVELPLGIQGAVGPRTLTAAVNPQATFSEGDFANNVLVFSFRVANPPDLVIAASDLSAQPTVAALYQAVDVTVRVRNVGDAVARDVHLQLFDGAPEAGGRLVAETVFNAVAPGTPRTMVGRVTPEVLSPLHLFARVDPENAVGEADENNNVASLDLNVVDAADYVVDLVESLSLPATVTQGDKLYVGHTIHAYVDRNGARYPYPPFWPFKTMTTALYVGDGPTPTEVSRATFGADTDYHAATYTIGTNGLDGTMVFTAVADPGHLIDDSNPANNVARGTVTITTPDLSELWVDSSEIESDPASLAPGKTFTVRAAVHNTGRQPASNVRVDATGSSSRSVVVPVIAPGDTAVVQFALTAPTLPGLVRLTVSVDPLRVIQEGTKSNNSAVIDLWALAPADLDIASIDVDPATPTVGEKAYVTVDVVNIGTATANQITASVVQSATNYRRVLGTVASSSYPAPGQHRAFVIPVPTDGFLGDTPLTVEVVHDGWTGKPATSPLVLHVHNPDFAVASVGIRTTPSRPSPGDQVEADILVNNFGNGDGTTSVRIYRGYPESNDVVATGSVFVAAGGSAVFRATDVPIPATPPYVLSVVLDAEKAVPEPNEGNNTASRDVLDDPEQIVVAFDESKPHCYTVANNASRNYNCAPGAYSDWAKDLEARGYTVTTINPGGDGVTAAALRGVDVLVSALPLGYYEQRELDAIRTFMTGGGGFLLVGDWGSTGNGWVPYQDQVLAAFGWQNLHTEVGIPGAAFSICAGFSRGSGITNHPAAIGIDGVTGSLVGALSAGPDTTQPILVTSGGQVPQNAMVAASATFGAGRMAVVMDSNFFDSDYVVNSMCGAIPYAGAQNRRFAMQLVDWLVNGGPSDYLADLAFVPAGITVPATITAGDRVPLTVHVKNIGGSLAGANDVRVRFFDGAPETGNAIGDATIDALGVAEARDVTVTWDTTLASGAHVITAVVDPDGAIPEFDEGNNRTSVAATVRSAVDLQIAANDIALRNGTPPQIAVTIHNVGYRDAAPGATIDLSDEVAGVVHALRADALPAVPARGSVQILVPWPDADLASAHRIDVTLDPKRLLVDPTRDADHAVAVFSPPTMALAAPLDGTVWGSKKTVRWTSRSSETGALQHFVRIARAGQSFMEVGRTNGQSFDLDLSGYAKGDYVVRVVATDGVLSATRDATVHVDNGAAVRGFGTAFASTASFGAPGGTTTLSIPAGARVTSATLFADVAGATSTSINASPIYDYAGGMLTSYEGSLYYLYVNSSGELGYRRSDDSGATWAGFVRVSAAGQRVDSKAFATNASGIHVTYMAGGVAYALRCARQGWTSPVAIGSAAGSIAMTAGPDGIVAVFAGGTLNKAQLATAAADGTGWTAVDAPVQSTGSASFARGALHYVDFSSTAISYRRAPIGGPYSNPATYTTPVVVASGVYGEISDPHIWIDDDAVVVSYRAYGPGTYSLRVQRCELARDCSSAEAWLAAPIVVTSGGATAGLVSRVGGSFRAGWDSYRLAYGPQAGARWGPAFDPGIGLWVSEAAWLFGPDWVGIAGRYNGQIFVRWPALTPTDATVTVGASQILARPGMPGDGTHVADISDAINDYLATHTDADDGVVDGRIQVPITVTAGGAGQIVLRNVEIRTAALSAIAGYAQPRLFSPNQSPGVLDTARLSIADAAPIGVFDAAGQRVRTLAASPVGARNEADFDGRDDAGAALQSGLYGFGNAAVGPVATVEIDDVVPTALLNVDGSGSYGGIVEVRGRATDADFGGTPKNLAGWLLEYTTDGTSFTRIAAGTAPVDGVLARWDTRALSATSATLRLTVSDRAGNSAVFSQAVGISPLAPAPPTIDVPTIPGAPLDVDGPSITVAGAAEAGSTVTVYVDGAPLATAAESAGRYAVAAALQDGVHTIAARATRAGISSASSDAIVVARRALNVAISGPATLASGSSGQCSVTVTRTSVSTSPVTVVLSAVDSMGQVAPIGISPALQFVAPPAQGDASVSFTVDALRAPPGDYTLVASIAGTGAEARAPLRIDPVAALAAMLTSDRATYDALQPVSLAARVLNVAAGGDSGSLVASIRVISPSGTATTLGPFAFSPIPAGGIASVSALYGAPPITVGTYTAELSIVDVSSTVVGAAATSFEVVPAIGDGELVGSLLVNPTTYVAGEVLSAEYGVRNRGADASIPISVLLVDPATGLLLDRVDRTVALASGGSMRDVATVSTAAGAGQELIVVIVGNGRALAGEAIQPSLFRDVTPPVIVISGVDDGEYRSGSITPVIAVSDESPFTSAVSLNGAPFASGTTLTQDGSYELAARAEDAYGNIASATRSFVIDTVPPDVHVAGVLDGAVVSPAVVADITVADPHLRTSSALLDGTEYRTGARIDAEGDHRLVVLADDLAGNSRQVVVSFSIDRTPPVITADGIPPPYVNTAAVAPSFRADDPHLDTFVVAADGQPYLPGTPIDTEGGHVIVAAATDLAGNASSQEYRFVIDRTSPVAEIAWPPEGLLTSAAVQPEFRVLEQNPDGVIVTVDGVPWDGLPISLEGEHEVVVVATDLAGNSGSASRRFTIDRTPPTVATTGIQEGAIAGAPVEVFVSCSDEHLVSCAPTLDGAAWAPGTVSSEGDHVVVVVATDGAGNVTTRSLRFAIDQTPPAIAIGGVRDGQITNQTLAPTIAVRDAHPGPAANVELDGRPFASGTPVHEEGDHTLTVSARDAAGNLASAIVRFTQDFTAPVLTITGVTDGETSFDPVFPAFPAADAHPGDVAATLDGMSFSSGAVVDRIGEHVLTVVASDAAGNQARLEVRFAVALPQATLDTRLDPTPRVLIALGCLHADAACDARATYLRATFDDASLTYDIAPTPASVLAALRHQSHDVVIMYRNRSAEAQTVSELREAVFAGIGVVVVNDPPPDNDPKLATVEGVSIGGKLSTPGPISLVAGDLGPARTLTLSGAAAEQRLGTAGGIGTTSGGTVVVSTNRYGNGRAATITFNPEESRSPDMAALLVSAVAFSAPSTPRDFITGAPVAVQLEAVLDAPAWRDMTIAARLSGLALVEAPHADRLDPVTWRFMASSGDPVERRLVVIPDSPGAHAIDATLLARFGAADVEVAHGAFALTTRSAADLQAAALAKLAAIPSDVQKAIATVSALDVAPATRAAAEQAIADLLGAIDVVAPLATPEAIVARREMDALLRTLEVLSTTVP